MDKADHVLISRETKDFFSNKKTRISFVLAVLVFVIHISTFSNYNLAGNDVGLILLNFEKVLRALAQVAVPLFFVISAVLFYRDYTYGKTIYKLKKRFFTLVIPYLCWNTIWTVFQFVCFYTFVSKFFIGREPVKFSLSTIVQGVFLHKFTPFWFVFDLIIFSILSPIIYTLVKSKRMGIIWILIVYVLDCFGMSISESVFFRSDSIIYYMLGAYIGVHFWSWFKEKTHHNMQLTLYFIAFVLFSTIYVTHFLFGYLKFLEPLVICAWALSFWKAFDIFSNKRIFTFEKESFFVYAMHVDVSAVITKVIYITFPKSVWVAPINYVLTVCLTIAFICAFAYCLNKKFPKISKILGSRN